MSSLPYDVAKYRAFVQTIRASPEEEKDNFARIMDQLLDDMDRIHVLNGTLRAQQEALLSENKRAINENRRAEKKNQLLVGRNELLQDELLRHQKEVSQLTAQHSALQNEAKRAHVRWSEGQDEIERLQSELSGLKANEDEGTRRYYDAVVMEQRALQKVALEQEYVKEVEARELAIHEAMSSKDGIIRSLQDELGELKTVLLDLEDERCAAENKLSAEMEEVGKYKEKWHSVSQELSSLNVAHDLLHVQLSEKDGEIAQLRDRLNTISADLAEQSSLRISGEEKLKERQREIERLRLEEAKIVPLQGDKAELQRRIQDCKMDLEVAERNYTRLEEVQRKHLQSQAELQLRYQASEEIASTLRRSTMELENSLSSVMAENERLLHLNRRLQEKATASSNSGNVENMFWRGQAETAQRKADALEVQLQGIRRESALSSHSKSGLGLGSGLKASPGLFASSVSSSQAASPLPLDRHSAGSPVRPFRAT